MIRFKKIWLSCVEVVCIRCVVCRFWLIDVWWWSLLCRMLSVDFIVGLIFVNVIWLLFMCVKEDRLCMMWWMCVIFFLDF